MARHKRTSDRFGLVYERQMLKINQSVTGDGIRKSQRGRSIST